MMIHDFFMMYELQWQCIFFASKVSRIFWYIFWFFRSFNHVVGWKVQIDWLVVYIEFCTSTMTTLFYLLDQDRFSCISCFFRKMILNKIKFNDTNICIFSIFLYKNVLNFICKKTFRDRFLNQSNKFWSFELVLHL